MKIAVIGGGFTGLAAARDLSGAGHDVYIYEKEKFLGGMAWGFKGKNWDWNLEASYHHLFTNDDTIISLMRDLGISDALIKVRPVTANYWHGTAYQFDSPAHLLAFPGISLSDKMRTGSLAAFCKLYPFWQSLEGMTAKHLFTTWGGRRSWEIIWEPLMTGKFGHYDNTIAASWLWARIHKRTPSLYYIRGGFQTLIDALAGAVRKNGGKILTGAAIDSVTGDLRVTCRTAQKIVPDVQFDRILLTVPTPVADRLFHHTLLGTHDAALTIPHLHAQTLILETDTPVLDSVYWLSITDRSFPFLAVVAHTNFMDSARYGNRHITYIGNYLPEGHPYLSMSKHQLLRTFLPYIKRLARRPRFTVHNSYLFNVPFAQPVHQTYYSRRAPKLVTQIPGVFLANMDSIVPWDRGTNYAVALGQKAAKTIAAL